RGALSRYSLIGAVLRSDGDVPAARQVAARVSAAIAKEPFRAAAFVRLPRRDALLRGFAGLAVAAGVALGAVALVQQLRTEETVVPAAVVAKVEVPPVEPVVDDTEPAALYTTPPATESAAGIAPAELANFLVAHYGYAT